MALGYRQRDPEISTESQSLQQEFKTKMDVAAVIHKRTALPSLTPLKNTETSASHSFKDLFSKSASCKALFPFEVCFLLYSIFLLGIYLGRNWPLHPQAAVAISQSISKPLMKFTRQRVSAASTTIM